MQSAGVFKLLREVSIPGQPTQFTIGERLESFDGLLDEEIVVLPVVGLGRAGKSTFLGYLASSVDQYTLCRFQTGDSIDPVTHGVDACLLNLQNGKLLLLIDVEGLCNRDRPELDLFLAMVSQLAGDVVFLDRSINDTFRTSLSRMVCTRVSMDNDGAVFWPKLHLVLNMSRARVNADTITRAFAVRDGVTEEPSRVSRT